MQQTNVCDAWIATSAGGRKYFTESKRDRADRELQLAVKDRPSDYGLKPKGAKLLRLVLLPIMYYFQTRALLSPFASFALRSHSRGFSPIVSPCSTFLDVFYTAFKSRRCVPEQRMRPMLSVLLASMLVLFEIFSSASGSTIIASSFLASRTGNLVSYPISHLTHVNSPSRSLTSRSKPSHLSLFDIKLRTPKCFSFKPLLFLDGVPWSSCSSQTLI